MFKKGQSGNPKGRPPSKFAENVRLATKDGKELLDFYINILRDKKQKPELRMEAAKRLEFRGFGTPGASVDDIGQDNPSAIVIPLQSLGKAGEYRES